MRQIGATGNSRMGCMRELPVGQGSARVRWGSEKSAAVTAGSCTHRQRARGKPSLLAALHAKAPSRRQTWVMSSAITVTVHSTSHQGCNRAHCHRNSQVRRADRDPPSWLPRWRITPSAPIRPTCSTPHQGCNRVHCHRNSRNSDRSLRLEVYMPRHADFRREISCVGATAGLVPVRQVSGIFHLESSATAPGLRSLD